MEYTKSTDTPMRQYKPKQDWRQGGCATERPVGRAYAVEPLVVGKELI